jgi:two-component system response regulator
MKSILLAEDSDDDVLILRRALKPAAAWVRLHVVENGLQVIEYLTRTGCYHDPAAHPWPDLLLLDLKMPGMGGFEILQWLNRRPRAARVPVAILSGSELHEDRVRTQELGAVRYFVKPIPAPEILQILQTVDPPAFSETSGV